MTSCGEAAEYNSTWSWNLRLPKICMDKFERSQHYYVPFVFSCQGTFVIVFHWFFLTPQRKAPIKHCLKGILRIIKPLHEYKHFSRAEVHATNMLKFNAYVDRCGTTFRYIFSKFCETFLT